MNKSSSGNVPADTIKQCDFYLQALTNYINQSTASGKFRDSLKPANISPVYKTKDPLDKANYRPVSILPLAWQRYTKDEFWSVMSAYQQNFEQSAVWF